MEETSSIIDIISVELSATTVYTDLHECYDIFVPAYYVYASDTATRNVFQTRSVTRHRLLRGQLILRTVTAFLVLVCCYSGSPKHLVLTANPVYNDLNISPILILTFQLRPAALHVSKHRTTNNSRHIKVATTWTVVFRLKDRTKVTWRPPE